MKSWKLHRVNSLTPLGCNRCRRTRRCTRSAGRPAGERGTPKADRKNAFHFARARNSGSPLQPAWYDDGVTVSTHRLFVVGDGALEEAFARGHGDGSAGRPRPAMEARTVRFRHNGRVRMRLTFSLLPPLAEAYRDGWDLGRRGGTTSDEGVDLARRARPAWRLAPGLLIEVRVEEDPAVLAADRRSWMPACYLSARGIELTAPVSALDLAPKDADRVEDFVAIRVRDLWFPVVLTSEHTDVRVRATLGDDDQDVVLVLP
ncbi:Hypothetical protein A7982_02151 [Minicystis rosea]|nr:Hypothetical protein A7982_02151 [Minicystis rosea]